MVGAGRYRRPGLRKVVGVSAYASRVGSNGRSWLATVYSMPQSLRATAMLAVILRLPRCSSWLR